MSHERRFSYGDGEGEGEELPIGTVRVIVDENAGSEDEEDGDEEDQEILPVDPTFLMTYEVVASAVLAEHDEKLSEEMKAMMTRRALSLVYSSCLCRGIEPDVARKWLDLLGEVKYNDLKLKVGNSSGNGDKVQMGFRQNGGVRKDGIS